MEKQDKALRLAMSLESWAYDETLPVIEAWDIAYELRRLHAENELLMNALWKACGDDGEVVNDIIESQR
jgi:hypothetical protein